MLTFEQKLHLVLESAKPNLKDLSASNISFVVVGARAINAYIDRPRNTQDIDILTYNYKELSEYIDQHYPNLTKEINPAEIRYKLEDEEILDILIPYHKIFEIALKDVIKIGNEFIPSVEALIALKFAAIMGKHRPVHRKMQDRVDIGQLLTFNKVNIDKVREYISCLYEEAPKDFDIFIDRLKLDFNLSNI